MSGFEGKNSNTMPVESVYEVTSTIEPTLRKPGEVEWEYLKTPIDLTGENEDSARLSGHNAVVRRVSIFPCGFV